MHRFTVHAGNSQLRNQFVSSKAARGLRAVRSAVEAMEPRLLLSNSIVVNSTADTAVGDSTTTGPTVSLREAVNYENANGGGTISFASALTASGPATITLSTSGDGTAGPSDFGIHSNITIIGATGSNGISIANSGAQRLFYIGTGSSLTLENLTLSGGDAVGGSGGDGGGAAGLGGAIFNAGTLDISQSTLQSNTAHGGAGDVGTTLGGGGLGGPGDGAGDGGGPNGGMHEVGGGFGGGGAASKRSGGFGGGGGISASGGGGFGAGGGSNPGFSGGFGGGAGNSTGGGGGAGMGGAIFNYGGTVTLTNSTLANNSALGGTGVGFAIAGNGPAVIAAPSGQGLGGAIFNLNGSITSDDSTLAYNTAANGGGAIYNHGDTPADVGSQTGGPALPSAAASVTLNNSILADSAASVSDFFTGTSNTGTQTTAGTNNLIQTTPANFTPTGGAPATLTGDPSFATTSAAANGGPTPTFALPSTSPAIGAASTAVNVAAAISTDQRGAYRASPPSLGAYDPGIPGSLTVTTTADLTSGAGGDNSLREAVEYAEILGGSQTITFAPTLTTSAPATIALATVGDNTAGPSDLGIDTNITLLGPTGSNGIAIANIGGSAAVLHRARREP